MADTTIMLVCASGMSTSLLVSKMKKAAEEKGVDAEIFAVSASDADNNLANKDIDVLRAWLNEQQIDSDKIDELLERLK